MKKLYLSLIMILQLSTWSMSQTLYAPEGNIGVSSSTTNVGIGTNNPGSLLSIVRSNAGKNTDGLDNSLLYLNNGSVPDGSIIIKSHSIDENEVIGAIKFHVSPDNINYSQAAIKALAGRSSKASTIAFYTSTSNTQQRATEVMRIKGNNVGIGTTDPQNKLSVNGTIWASEVKVALTDGADWVFEQNYKLRSLEEVEDFIKENKHLPDVPSAEEFRKNGLNIAEMDNLLLQKIEELTLYLIEQQKKNTKLQERIKCLEEQLTNNE